MRAGRPTEATGLLAGLGRRPGRRALERAVVTGGDGDQGSVARREERGRERAKKGEELTRSR